MAGFSAGSPSGAQDWREVDLPGIVSDFSLGPARHARSGGYQDDDAAAQHTEV